MQVTEVRRRRRTTWLQLGGPAADTLVDSLISTGSRQSQNFVLEVCIDVVQNCVVWKITKNQTRRNRTTLLWATRPQTVDLWVAAGPVEDPFVFAMRVVMPVTLLFLRFENCAQGRQSTLNRSSSHMIANDISMFEQRDSCVCKPTALSCTRHLPSRYLQAISFRPALPAIYSQALGLPTLSHFEYLQCRLHRSHC